MRSGDEREAADWSGKQGVKGISEVYLSPGVSLPLPKFNLALSAKTDSKCVIEASRCLWTQEQLASRSVTGTACRNKPGSKAKREASPEKMEALRNLLERYVSLHPRANEVDVVRVAALGDLMTNYLTDCGRRVRKRLEMLAAKEATTKKRRTAATAVENLAHSSASSPNVPQAAPPTATIDSPASLAPAVTPPLEEPESTDGTSEPKQLRGVEPIANRSLMSNLRPLLASAGSQDRRPGKFKSMCTNAAITTLHSITGTMLVQLDTGGTYAEAAARGAAPPLKATVGTQYSLRDLECSPSPPTTSEASVGSQTPAGPPKVPRARTVPHRPGPKPRVVLDATPTQSSEGPTPSTSQREEEAMEVSAYPTEPPPPAKGAFVVGSHYSGDTRDVLGCPFSAVRNPGNTARAAYEPFDG
ncbi:hypothetical protein HPB47_015462 [Ixodes persulcatus]|uniref:Uncharacterized protein n=1 Tax=Ixodes persulcatus TaxID=34615 RepID=A0AC60QTF8_IXOPE|nr:hypothetical protein HPB47_015462 [Ixodes persulcatus]